MLVWWHTVGLPRDVQALMSCWLSLESFFLLPPPRPPPSQTPFAQCTLWQPNAPAPMTGHSLMDRGRIMLVITFTLAGCMPPVSLGYTQNGVGSPQAFLNSRGIVNCCAILKSRRWIRGTWVSAGVVIVWSLNIVAPKGKQPSNSFLRRDEP